MLTSCKSLSLSGPESSFAFMFHQKPSMQSLAVKDLVEIEGCIFSVQYLQELSNANNTVRFSTMEKYYECCSDFSLNS